MYQPLILFLGLRYVYKCSTERFGYFIFWLSIIGISLGVMALIVVISVMNGFEEELQNKIIKLIPQAIIVPIKGSLNPQLFPESFIKLCGVERSMPLTISDVVLQSSNGVAIGVMLGVDPDRRDPLSKYLVNVKQSDLYPGKYNVILGKKLAENIGVNRNDQLRILIPSVSNVTPIGRLFSQRLFNVIGVFSTNSEVDSYQLLVNIQDASHIMQYPIGNITGWRLFLKNPLEVDKFKQQIFPYNTQCKDWRERKGELFHAIHMEKNMMGLLLSLIVAVAACNILTSLGLMIMEKQREIAILQTQGFTPNQIMMIFIVQGASAGIIGTFLGMVIGIIFANKINNLTLIIRILFNSTMLPVEIRPLQILTIMVTTITVILVSTLYPSWYASTFRPADVLRYE